ncbi:MAG: cytochrome c maturation protein CcmE, partial [Actinobacteria bacterium]|nr:cytochrome c maturation protein CcmE [Actinomycetota bacterium]
AVLAVVLIGGSVLVVKFLTNAVDYYCNVDELGHKDGCEAGRRLRVQGNVEQGSVSETDGVTTFVMTFNGVDLPVRYAGEPGGIFQECVPVVVHGRLDDETGVFDGDRVEVKHDNQYEAENGDRIDKAQAACSQPA